MRRPAEGARSGLYRNSRRILTNSRSRMVPLIESMPTNSPHPAETANHPYRAEIFTANPLLGRTTCHPIQPRSIGRIRCDALAQQG